MNRLLVFLTLLSAALLAQQEVRFEVRYLSAENVYLDGGRVKGLDAGDTLVIRRSGNDVQLLVMHAADYSASCQVLTPGAKVAAGDIAIFIHRKTVLEEPEADKKVVTAQPAAPAPVKKEKRRTSRTRRRNDVTGTVSASWYGLRDQTAAGLDFDQPSFRLNLRARQLWQRPLTLRVRTRSRYNQRSRTFNDDVPREQWRNRLYEASLRYEDRYQRVNFGVGRLIATEVGGIGYIDGGQISLNVSPSWAIGVIGGIQPDWRTSAFDTEITKAAYYLNFRKRGEAAQYFDATLAFSGEYGDGEVSRELFYWRGTFRQGKFGLYSSLEMDLNRGWRKEKTDQSLTLTNLLLNSDFRITERFTVGATYDNRRSYWFYQIQSTPDSLFDDALRTGFRLNAALRLPLHLRITINGGYRDGASSRGSTTSWGANLSKSRLLHRTVNLNVGYSGFESDAARGTTINSSLRWRFYRMSAVRLGYGYYGYRFDLLALSSRRESRWLRMGLDIDLPQSLYLQGDYDIRNGDDLDGSVFNVVLGYRL